MKPVPTTPESTQRLETILGTPPGDSQALTDAISKAAGERQKYGNMLSKAFGEEMPGNGRGPFMPVKYQDDSGKPLSGDALKTAVAADAEILKPYVAFTEFRDRHYAGAGARPVPVVATADAPVRTASIETAQTGETRVTQTADRSVTPPAETGPVSRFFPEAKPTIMDGSAPANATHAAGDSFNLGVGTTSAAGVGLAFGAYGLYASYHAGDNVGTRIAVANLASSSLEVTHGLMTAAGKTLPVITKAGKFIPVANIALTAVDGAYQISMEDTLAHKAERGAVVAAAAGSAVFVAPLAATGVSATLAATGLGAAIGTGAVATAAVAAAPVVVTTAVVLGVVWAGGKIIEFKRERESLDASIADNAKPEKRQGVTSEDGKPTIRAFKHIPITMLRTSVDMKDENLNGKLVRNKQGQIPIGEILKLDMRDPKNIAEVERVLALHISKQEDIMKANETYLPKWLDPREKVSKYTLAQMELADLTAARAELDMYKNEMKAWDAAHPDDPATTRTATRRTQPASAAPNKPAA